MTTNNGSADRVLDALHAFAASGDMTTGIAENAASDRRGIADNTSGRAVATTASHSSGRRAPVARR